MRNLPQVEKQPFEKVASDMNERREDFEARMIKEGYVITYPKENQLQLDIDNQQQFETFLRNWEIMKREGFAAFYRRTPSKSGYPCCHIRITVDRPDGTVMSDEERIAWQAALGSDPVRELLSLIRVKRGDRNPSLLVETAAYRPLSDPQL